MNLGSYEIIRQIGEGGFGRTYEARHVLLKNVKACLKQNINLSTADAQLLMHEAEVMAGVQHHSLPAWRDFYKIGDGSYVLAMSFIEGKSLDKAVEKHKAIHAEDVCWISQRLLNALYVLHGKGIIHGDVKPPNIIVQPKEHNAVLVDYGLSCIHPTRGTKAVGYTAIFAAPEIIDGKPPLPESDLYSLGLTMIYAMGGDPIAKTLPDHVPKKVQEFCTDLVRYNPIDRPTWEKQDLVARLSDVRLEAFGRRHST
ncbi:serine/threonine protein kinase [Candidatus Woesearchaeota archaeon]|nr:serine/threonine protein kinase [Candidatus Woesearchaeota archaeon]